MGAKEKEKAARQEISGEAVAERIRQLGLLFETYDVGVDPITCLACIGLGVKMLLAGGATSTDIRKAVKTFVDDPLA